METLTPRTLTTMDKLPIGARFVKMKDKKRIVWQVVKGRARWTGYQCYKHWAIVASIADHPRSNDEMIARHMQAINGNTEVIFLRNVNDPHPIDLQ